MTKSIATIIRLALVISLFGDPAVLMATGFASSVQPSLMRAPNASHFLAEALAEVDPWVEVSQAAEVSGKGIVDHGVRTFRMSVSETFGPGQEPSQTVSWKLRETKIDPRVEEAIARLVKNVENERDWLRARGEIFIRAHQPEQFRLIVEDLALSMVYPSIDVSQRATKAFSELLQEPRIGGMSVELPGEEGGPVMAMEWAYFYVLIVLRLDWGEEMSIGRAFWEYWQHETLANNDQVRVSARKNRGRDLLEYLAHSARAGGYAEKLAPGLPPFYDILAGRDVIFRDPKVAALLNTLRRDLDNVLGEPPDNRPIRGEEGPVDAYAGPIDSNFMLGQWEVRAWEPIPSNRHRRNRKVLLTLGKPGNSFEFQWEANADGLVIRYGLSRPQAEAMIAYIIKNGSESQDAAVQLEEDAADRIITPARSSEMAQALRPLQPKERLKIRPAQESVRRQLVQEGELLGIRYFPAVGGRPEELELSIQVKKPTPHQATRRFTLEQLVAAGIAAPPQARLSFADARARAELGGAFDAGIYAETYLAMLAEKAPAPLAKDAALPVKAEFMGDHLAGVEIPVWDAELRDYYRWIKAPDEVVKRHEPALLRALPDLVRASRLERLLAHPYEQAKRALEDSGAKIGVDWVGPLDRPVVTVSAKGADDSAAFLILTETSAGPSALSTTLLALPKALQDLVSTLGARENARLQTLPEGTKINIARLAATAVVEEDEQYGLAEWQDVPRRIAARRLIMAKYRLIPRFHENVFHAVLAMWTPVPLRRVVVFRGESPEAMDGRRLRAGSRLQAALARPNLTNADGGLDITKIFNVAKRDTEDRVANGARDELQSLYEPIREGKPPLFSEADRSRFTLDGLWSTVVATFIDTLQKRNLAEKERERVAAAEKERLEAKKVKAKAAAKAAVQKAIGYFFQNVGNKGTYKALAKTIAKGAEKFRVDPVIVVQRLQAVRDLVAADARGIIEALDALPQPKKPLSKRNARSA